VCFTYLKTFFSKLYHENIITLQINNQFSLKIKFISQNGKKTLGHNKIIYISPKKTKQKKDTLATKKNIFRDKHIWCADDTPYGAPHHP